MSSPADIFTTLLAPISGHAGSCTAVEYRAVLEQLTALAPCRLLIFGCGRDSAAWLAANRGGSTVFLEDSLDWAARTRALLPEADIIGVSYPARPDRWRFHLAGLREGTPAAELVMPLPERVRQESWDLIFVDGPVSELFGGRGRQSSLVAAAQLARPETAVCVHDTDRPLERLFCRELFDHSRSFRQVERMRIYPPCPVTSAGR